MSTTYYTDAVKKYGSYRKAAIALGMKRTTFFDNYSRERKINADKLNAHEPHEVSLRGGTVKRYIFTCAVRGCHVHEDFLKNLEAYAKHIGAELVIGALMNAGRTRHTDYDSTQFAPEVVPYVSLQPIEIGDKVKFCPELNLTATAVKPLQGLQTYTKRRWGIFPHTKIAVDSVPTHKGLPTKFILTTGAVTHPSYSSTKAGFRAHFDHVHGAVVVEVSKEGTWFRHVTPTSDEDGTFYDLDKKIVAGEVKDYGGVKGIVYGDIHIELLDDDVAKATWGIGAKTADNCLAGKLNPEVQVFHDLLDMTAANYHELDNIFKRYERWYNKKNFVHDAFKNAVDFMAQVRYFSDHNVVVDSNHEYFVEKWLLKFDPSTKEDFDNIELYYKLKLAILADIKQGPRRPFLELLLSQQPNSLNVTSHFTFLSPDESYMIDKVECGWHGHRGPNGSRGSKAAFKFVTDKVTVGHMHSPGVESGCHVVGTSSKLDLSYNLGPSSWAHTHGIIYPHGGRTLITMSNGKFWADQDVK